MLAPKSHQGASLLIFTLSGLVSSSKSAMVGVIYTMETGYYYMAIIYTMETISYKPGLSF